MSRESSDLRKLVADANGAVAPQNRGEVNAWSQAIQKLETKVGELAARYKVDVGDISDNVEPEFTGAGRPGASYTATGQAARLLYKSLFTRGVSVFKSLSLN